MRRLTKFRLVVGGWFYALGLALGLVLGACNPAEYRLTKEPKCFEDEVKVVAPQRPGQEEDLRWVCVPLDDFADEDSIARLDAILAER